jgi:hypothetical protein
MRLEAFQNVRGSGRLHPLVANRSFMPIGTPASLPRGLPAARSASTLAAASRAALGVVTMKAFKASCASATAR